MNKYKILWREYMNKVNSGEFTLIADNMIEAIRIYEKSKPLHVIYQINLI